MCLRNKIAEVLEFSKSLSHLEPGRVLERNRRIIIPPLNLSMCILLGHLFKRGVYY